MSELEDTRKLYCEFLEKVEVPSLEQKLEIALEALEFYAEIDNWNDNDKNQFQLSSIEHDGSTRARQAIKEIKGDE